MEITIITPLFPPDVSTPAVYAKTLTERLATRPGVILRLIHYGELPEAVPGVSIVSVPGRTLLPLRILSCLIAIWRARTSDLFIVLNGPSVELPFLLISSLVGKRCLYLQNDQEALSRPGFILESLRENMRRIAVTTITPPLSVLDKPILHPLRPESNDARRAYEAAVTDHITTIATYANC